MLNMICIHPAFPYHANVHKHITSQLLPLLKELRLIAFRNADPPDSQRLSVLKGAVVLRVGEDHRLACQGQCIHQLSHALRLCEAPG